MAVLLYFSVTCIACPGHPYIESPTDSLIEVPLYLCSDVKLYTFGCHGSRGLVIGFLPEINCSVIVINSVYPVEEINLNCVCMFIVLYT